MLTDEQLKERKKGIGGSDAAKAIGKSQWGTPYDVYADKLGLSKPIEANIAMQMGSALEEMILKEYEKTTCQTITRFKDQVKPFLSNANQFMLANLDGLTSDGKVIVEAKTAKDRIGWGEEGTNNIPQDYLIQVMHYCLVMNASHADIIVLFINEKKYGHYRYERKEKWEEKLIAAERNFWNNHVLAENPPPITTIEQAKIAFPTSKLKEIFVNDKMVKICLRIEKLKRLRKKFKAMKESKELEVRLTMGLHEIMKDVNGDGLYTWTNQDDTRIDQTSLKAEDPEIAKKHTKTKQIRVLRQKKVKKNEQI